MNTKHFLTIAALVALATICVVDPALAQDVGGDTGGDEWWTPITELFTVLQTGIGKIGSYVVGIGLCIIGVIGAVTGRLDSNRIIIIILAGILVVSGPTIADKLM
tara:strand:- start:3858 stop:4172 length:315 start_codon:yes stop_codon:yes gene_type:complete